MTETLETLFTRIAEQLSASMAKAFVTGVKSGMTESTEPLAKGAVAGCIVPGCQRPAKVKGLCASHYGKARRSKFVGPTFTEEQLAELAEDARGKRFAASGRSKPVVARTPTRALPPVPSCVVPGCSSSAKTKGLCGRHYQKVLRNKLDSSRLTPEQLELLAQDGRAARYAGKAAQPKAAASSRKRAKSPKRARTAKKARAGKKRG